MQNNLQPKIGLKPYVSTESKMAEFSLKAIIFGAICGIIFGASTVYLALKSGLTVSASIPVAILSISLGRKFFKTTILENNIIQTTASAGDSIAGGVVFTLPAFLFLSIDSERGDPGALFFTYQTIFILAVLGGLLGTLMMIPLRRLLIVREHENLPYPEGTACASTLIAGDRGGDSSKIAYMGFGFAFLYTILQKVINVIAETPTFTTHQTNKNYPSATFSGEITPEYMGLGYIIGPGIAGVLVSGGILAWLGLIPLLASIVPMETIAGQLVNLGFLKSIDTSGGSCGWDPATKTFTDTSGAIYLAYIRQIGAGAVAAGGLITLIKTIPTIIQSFSHSLSSINVKKNKPEDTVDISRTETDLSPTFVVLGSILLAVLVIILPQIPGNTIFNKTIIGFLVIVFGFFFVTVASRIVGLVGSSSSPISGMTIATLMGTCLIFISIGWTGAAYEPMALVVGAIICIAAANGGATSQDLKSGFIVGSTPKYQQIALFIGAVISSIFIGFTVKILDTPTQTMMEQGINHAIGTAEFPAPQSALISTLIKGLLSYNLDWQFVLAGVFLAISVELCGVGSLSFAVGAYLPLATTLPIFVGGFIKSFVTKKKQKNTSLPINENNHEMNQGNFFATGLVAGGAVAGVIYAFVRVGLGSEVINKISMENFLSKDEVLGHGGYQVMGFLFFIFMGFCLYRLAIKK